MSKRTRSVLKTTPTLADLGKALAENNKAYLRKAWHYCFKTQYRHVDWGVLSQCLVAVEAKLLGAKPTHFRDRLHPKVMLYMVYAHISMTYKAAMLMDQMVNAISLPERFALKDLQGKPVFGCHRAWTAEEVKKAEQVCITEYTTQPKSATESKSMQEAMTTTENKPVEQEPEVQVQSCTHNEIVLIDNSQLIEPINGLLRSSGCKHSLQDIERFLNQGLAAERELKQLKSQPIAQYNTCQTSTLGSSIPEGKVVYRKASEIFEQFNQAPLFNFDVPCFEWTDRHPDVPTLDPDYQFEPDYLMPVLDGLIHDHNTWVWGHTGTGKTTMIQQMAARLQWPVIRINFDSDISRFELLGRDSISRDDQGQVVSSFVEGPLARAMHGPYILLLDEYDYIRGDASYILQSVLDSRTLMLSEDGARKIQADPFLRICACNNTNGQGDDSGLYPDAKVQSSASLDRFENWVYIEYMSPADEIKLIRKRVSNVTKKDTRLLMDYVKEHRQAFTDARVTVPLTPRTLCAMAEKLVFYRRVCSDGEAIRATVDAVIMHRASLEDKAVLREIIQRTFPLAGY